MNMVEKIKRTIFNFLSSKGNIAIILVLMLAFLIRIYYFFNTAGQTLWWDEAEYMATAVHWAFDVPYELNPQRPPLFQFIASIFLKINFGEEAVKFILVVLPSVFLVFAIYLLGKEMYGRKTALIAALIASFSWSLVFWSARIQPDFLSMAFQVLSILFMWKFWRSRSSRLIILSGIFAGLGFYFKISALLVPLSFGVFILIRERFKAFKEKNYYLFLTSYFLSLVPYLIWSYVNFKTFTAFRTGYSNAIGTETAFSWSTLTFFKVLTDNPLYILFIIGLVFGLRFFIKINEFTKDKNKSLNPDLFSLIVLIVVSAFYIFYIRSTEDRWVFLWLPFIFFFISNAVLLIYNLISRYTRFIATLVVFILLISSFYSQANHFNSLIENKKTTYSQVKEASIWLRENSNPGDRVLSASYTQSVYYTRLNVTAFSFVNGDFDYYLENNRPRYLQVSIYERLPDWLMPWISQNEKRLNPVKYYTISENGNEAVSLIIYEVKYP